VIIDEIAKEVENNTITRVNEYVRQYVSRRNVDTVLEDQTPKVVVLDVLKCCTFVFMYLFVLKKKTKRELKQSRLVCLKT
jgi:hypothetical protein